MRRKIESCHEKASFLSIRPGIAQNIGQICNRIAFFTFFHVPIVKNKVKNKGQTIPSSNSYHSGNEETKGGIIVKHSFLNCEARLNGLAVAGLMLAAMACTAPAAEQPANLCRLILSESVPAVVGHEISIYFDNVVLLPDSRQVFFDVTCAKGMQQEERWTLIPKEADVGDVALTLDVLDAESRIIASAKTIIRVAPADVGKGKEVRFLVVGDSLTEHSVYPEHILTLCKAPGNPSLTLLGTNHIAGFSPENRHEGYGGWTFKRFATFYSEERDPARYRSMCSPFVFMEEGKPTLDFNRYIEEKCGGKAPDFVSVELGCNDIYGANEAGQQSAIDEALANADKLVAAILSAGPDIRLGLMMLTPPAASQDAFGNNGRCGQTRWQYRRNQHRFVEQLKQKYAGREKERIYLIPTYLSLDTRHGFPTDTMLANAHATETITRQSNAVHPSAVGYKQMGDSLYAWLKVMLANL